MASHLLFIDGQWVKGTAQQQFESKNPATEKTIGSFEVASLLDVQRAIFAAKKAFPAWKNTPAAHRGKILLRFARLLEQNKESLAKSLTEEMGKVISEARGDVQEAIDTAEYMAGEGRRLFGHTTPSELPEMGGLPHELGSTGFGVFHATKIAAEHAGIDLKKAKIAVEGFGNVGTFASKFLEQAGARIVATSDSKGTIYNPNGLSYEKLMLAKKEKGTVTAYGNGSQVLPTHDIVSLPVDILVTAAIPDLLHTKDVDRVRARLIVEGSNIPMSEQTEEFLHHKGVLVVPDFVANAGGVISSYVEYTGGTAEEMFKLVQKKIVKNTQMVLEQSEKSALPPRKVAMNIAKKRVLQKCKICQVELPEMNTAKK